MPVVDRISGYRFFFSSSDGDEPPHIHVQKDKRVAKFWLEPVRVAKFGRFHAHEIAEAERIVRERREAFLQAWNEFFDVTA